MGRKPTKKQSFFKVLLGDFSNHLRIPQKFTKNHIPQSLGKCVLRGPIIKRDVELEWRKNGVFFHSHGWHSFVKHNLLQVGDFLVFHYDGKSKFKVKLYDRTCCEIDIDVAPKRRNGLATAPSANEGFQLEQVKDELVDDLEAENYNRDTENVDGRRRNNYMSGKPSKVEDGEGTSTGSIIFQSEYSCFTASLKHRSLLYRVDIPRGLVLNKDLKGKETVEIEDSTGRLWPAKLVSYTCSRNSLAMYISTGWGECCKANKIVVGDTVVLEFVQQTVLRLHVFKKGLGTRGGSNRLVSVVLDAPNIKN